MNITQDSEESEVIRLQERLDEIYDKYHITSEDDKVGRSELRREWKVLTKRHQELTKFHTYNKTI